MTGKHWVSILLVGLLLAVPGVLELLDLSYYIMMVNMSLINLIAALGLILIYNHAGQLSLAHGAVMGFGAYTSAILSTRYGVPFLVALPLAGLAAGLISLVAAPLVRLRGHFFAVGTFAFGELLHTIFHNWEFTGGAMGIGGVPVPRVLGLALSTQVQQYPLIVLVAGAVYWASRTIVRSGFGRVLVATAENESLVQAVGMTTAAPKVRVIFVGSFFAGMAGSLFAHNLNFVGAANFTFDMSIMLLIIAVAAGNRFTGAVISSVIFTFLPEMLRQVPGYGRFPSLRMVAFGLAVVLLVGFLPRGFTGLIERIRPPRMTGEGGDGSWPKVS